ncbi:MAG: succinyl-diaminopimelate desuccinylase [Acidimicrobiia bacterium]
MPPIVEAEAADLLGLTASLVAVPSVSHEERRLADEIEARLGARAATLKTERVGDSVVARTDHGRTRRIVVGGHLDTVPANGNADPRVDGDTLHGLGAADMKGGLAVMLRLAEDAAGGAADHDLTLVFYECEEVADEFNGVRRLFDERPDLVVGDLAILMEPTANRVEAGCQGSLHVAAHFAGERAHTARPWMGRNAIHHVAEVLGRIADHEPETVEVDGLQYREALQVVRIEGGVANNVVPDACVLTVNRRFAPRVSVDDAFGQVAKLLEGADRVELVSASPAGPPNLGDPLVADFIATVAAPVGPKLGWTDVARFASRGIPALNYGPGDPAIAHTAGERVDRASLEAAYSALAGFLHLRRDRG